MYLKYFILAMGLCFLIAGSFAYAQQDPNDLGEPDVIYFEAQGLHSNNTLWLSSCMYPWEVSIGIYLTSDNPINGLVIPLVDTAYGPELIAYLDSVKNNPDSSFKGGIVENFDSLVVDLSYNPPQVLYVASDTNDSVNASGSYLIARMVYSIGFGSSLPEIMCLDSLIFPTGEQLKLIRTDGVHYTPQFESKCFVVSEKAATPPNLYCTDKVLGLDGDTVTYEVQASDVDGDIVPQSAYLIISGVDSTHYSLITLGSGSDLAIWRVEFYPEGLEFGEYKIRFKVRDEFMCWSECTTEVYHTRIGDADCDYDVELSDVIFLANYLLKSGDAPLFSQLGDVNCNGGIAIDDVIYLANYLLKSGPEPCAEI